MTKLNPKYFRLLASLFSRSVLAGLYIGRFPPQVAEIIQVSGIDSHVKPDSTVATFFQELYQVLCLNYRCEYIYKNTLARDILNKYHLEHSALLTEFRVDSCKADFVVANGTSAVYEIKTELDSFDRLERQLSAYLKVFDKIHVVVPANQENRIKGRIADTIGVVVLDSNGQLDKIREAQSNKHNVDPGVIFDSLRLGEYTTLIERQTGSVPLTRAADRYTVCREIVANLSPEVVHDEMVSLLKNRCSENRILAAINQVPSSLTMAYLASPLNKKQNGKFLEALYEPYRCFV